MNKGSLRYRITARLLGILIVPIFLLFGGQDNTQADPLDYYWFTKEFNEILKTNNCLEITQHQKDYPFYQLMTDEVLVAWCKEPLTPVRVKHGWLQLLHLVILTHSPTHPWAKCPQFMRMDNYNDPSYLWMEKPTQLVGKQLMLHDIYYYDGWDKPLRPGPKGVPATGPSLWHGERGAHGALMYCYQGAWLHGSDR